jgi:two-component system nitrogen regulation response regulator NtrX
MVKILIADDDLHIRSLLTEILTEQNYDVFEAIDGIHTLQQIKEIKPDLLLLDLKMPGLNGLEVIRQMTKFNYQCAVIVITAHGTIQSALEAIRHGVYDYIEKPISEERILLTIQNALKNKKLETENLYLRDTLFDEYKVIGDSESTRHIRQWINQIAQIDENIILTGSNGTGKDLIAQNIHLHSTRYKNPFIILNCAAIPVHLIESELFGFEKGAFTGANKTYHGKFELANTGTLFLNEITEMTLALQAKLLTVLDTNKLQRLGGEKDIKINTRIIAATNQDLNTVLMEKKMRQDLFYRLNVLQLKIPDLKDRKEDILPLAEHFMMNYCKQKGILVKTFEPDCMRILYNHSWPGNVRELKNLVTRLALMVIKRNICAEDILKLIQIQHEIPGLPTQSTNSLQEARDQFERDYITQILKIHDWNIRKAANFLEIERTYLYKLIHKLDIKRMVN